MVYKDPRKLMKYDSNFFSYYQQMENLRKLKNFDIILEDKDKQISEKKT